MHEFIDVIDFFIGAVNSLKAGTFSLHSPLEEMVLKVTGENKVVKQKAWKCHRRYLIKLIFIN